jgi:hypothetical protein
VAAIQSHEPAAQAVQTKAEEMIEAGWATAQDRLLSSKQTDSNSVIASRLADYLLTMPGYRGRYYLSILVSESCGYVFFTHRYKNVRTFVTSDRKLAREYIIQAALQGYCVFHGFNLDGLKSGMGSIEDIRKRSSGAKN